MRVFYNSRSKRLIARSVAAHANKKRWEPKKPDKSAIFAS